MSALRMDERGVIVVCPACGQKNRTVFERLGDIGKCGRCQAELGPPSAPVEIVSEVEFQNLLAHASLPIVVDFWAPWCGPCLRVAPELEKVAAGNAGRFLVTKVNTETLPTVAARYQVRSIPTMTVLVDGKEVSRTMGAQPAAAIETFVRQALK